MTEKPSKRCSKCGEVKPLEDFYVGRAECKACDAARKATYRAANAEKIKAREAAHRAAHPEKIKADKAAYRAAHPEKIKARNAAYRAAHPEKEKASKAAYRAANKEKIVAYWRSPKGREVLARSRHKRRAGYSEPWCDQQIYDRTEGLCHLCGEPVSMDEMHRDHIIPVSLGGHNVPNNVAAAHPKCNLAKQNKHVPSVIAVKEALPIEHYTNQGMLIDC